MASYEVLFNSVMFFLYYFYFWQHTGYGGFENIWSNPASDLWPDPEPGSLQLTRDRPSDCLPDQTQTAEETTFQTC